MQNKLKKPLKRYLKTYFDLHFDIQLRIQSFYAFQMDGNMVNGITLRVSFARRQNQTGQPRNLPVLFPRHRSAGGSDYVPSERNSGFRSPRKNRPNDLEPHQSQMSPPGMRKTSSVQMAWNQASKSRKVHDARIDRPCPY